MDAANQSISERAAAVADATRSVYKFFTESTWARRHTEPGICDFTFGNPHEPPLEGLVNALQRWSVPRTNDWFAYKGSQPEAQVVVAQSLAQRHGLPFDPEDIAMTNGGFAAIAVALRLVADAGDEIIYSLPAWFNYAAMILNADSVPVEVPLMPGDFALDLEAIEAAITPRTRIVIVNTPHNPTGRIYPPQTPMDLASILERASARYGRRIYLLSDEPYNRLVFDGRRFTSPVSFYDWTLIAYSYGKALLAPGERIGFLALSPKTGVRKTLRDRLAPVQIACGWMFPNNVLQYAIAELEALSIDIEHLQAKRDRMAANLRGLGYEVYVPEGTFYLLPRSPLADDAIFAELLADQNVFVIPGRMTGAPGYFRICLTATMDMIDRSLHGFEAALLEAQARRPAA